MIHDKYSNKTDQIDGNTWETQFHQNRGIKFGLFEFETYRNSEFEQEMISLEERDEQIKNLHVLNKQKLGFLYQLSVGTRLTSRVYIHLSLCLPACQVSSTTV